MALHSLAYSQCAYVAPVCSKSYFVCCFLLSLMSSHSLTLHVLGAKNLCGKKKGSSFAEVLILGKDGNKIARPRHTKTKKGCDSPVWDQKFVFMIANPSEFSGVFIRVWEKKSIRKDKFLGQLTIKINPELLLGAPVEDWYCLTKRGKAKETVSGKIQLRMSYSGKATKPVKTGTDSEETEEGDQGRGHGKLRLSSNYYKDNKKLTKTAVVVVEEEEEEEDFNIEGMDDIDDDSFRVGPQTPCLVKRKGQKITLSHKNTEVQNTGSVVEVVKANVAVNSGKWVFEATLQQADVSVGWCTQGYTGTADSGDCWVYSCNRMQKVRNGEHSESYGEFCRANDVITCAINIEEQEILFYRNSISLGSAYTDASVTNAGDRLVPCAVLSSRAKAKLNFGSDEGLRAFRAAASLPSSYAGLYCPLSITQKAELLELYKKYRDLDLTASGELGDAVSGEGAIQFQVDLGATDEEDPIFLVISWKLQCENMWTIAKEEWMHGFTMAGVHTMEGIKAKANEWVIEALSPEGFPLFFDFVFLYMKPAEQKYILIEEVEVIWDMLLKPRGWALYAQWMEFLKEKGQKYISRDVWQQLLEFKSAYPSSLEGYDDSEAWPLIFDEFAEHFRGPEEANGDGGDDGDVW